MSTSTTTPEVELAVDGALATVTALPDTGRVTREDGPDLVAVPEPRRRRRTVAIMVAWIASVVIAIFLAVSLNALAAGDAVRARDLERAVVDAERRFEQLVAEVAELSAPDRIKNAALELGMRPATDPVFIFLDRGLAGDERDVLDVGESTDPVKPVLSVER